MFNFLPLTHQNLTTQAFFIFNFQRYTYFSSVKVFFFGVCLFVFSSTYILPGLCSFCFHIFGTIFGEPYLFSELLFSEVVICSVSETEQTCVTCSVSWSISSLKQIHQPPFAGALSLS